MDDLNTLSAVEAVEALRLNKCSSEQLTAACLNRIRLRDSTVRAWEYLDEEDALQQARRLDKEKKNRPLQGLPVGIKDIIDTADMPTRYGSSIFANNQPGKDAECIRRLKDAGAVILGKTVTTEFAYLSPGKTCNPHNPEHTPGGSSSGSAAAVADFHVPLALGTQTAGSIIRPASFCGVVGYKPTFNRFSFSGIHPFAPSFDTLGVFSRSVADIALLSKVLVSGHENAELHQVNKVAIVAGPYWEQAEYTTKLMFESLPAFLRKYNLIVDTLELNKDFADINDAHLKTMLSESTDTLSRFTGKIGQSCPKNCLSIMNLH